jgi:hypothetical protein
MAAKIFINYRRGDDPGYAGRLCDQLRKAFGTNQVFMDVQDIAPGDEIMPGCLGDGDASSGEARNEEPAAAVVHADGAARQRSRTQETVFTDMECRLTGLTIIRLFGRPYRCVRGARQTIDR